MWTLCICRWFQSNECSRRPCQCDYCELIFPAVSHAEHVEYCSSRTESCAVCGQFVKLRDRKLHDESNCALPPVVAPPATSSSDDFLCDGMDTYRLSQLLCRDVTGSSFWPSDQRVRFNRYGQFNHTPPMGRMHLRSHGFVKRNRPGQLLDRGDGIPTSGSTNYDALAYRPKVVNGQQGANSASVPDDDDDSGKLCTELCCDIGIKWHW